MARDMRQEATGAIHVHFKTRAENRHPRVSDASPFCGEGVLFTELILVGQGHEFGDFTLVVPGALGARSAGVSPAFHCYTLKRELSQ